MSILLLLSGVTVTNGGYVDPPSGVEVAVAGGTITAAPSKQRHFRTILPDVIRASNWAEVITYEDEDVVILL